MSDPRIETEPDFIAIKRFGYSLKRLLNRYPETVPDETIALALDIPKDQVEVRYQSIVDRLKEKLRALL